MGEIYEGGGISLKKEALQGTVIRCLLHKEKGWRRFTDFAKGRGGDARKGCVLDGVVSTSLKIVKLYITGYKLVSRSLKVSIKPWGSDKS